MKSVLVCRECTCSTRAENLLLEVGYLHFVYVYCFFVLNS